MGEQIPQQRLSDLEMQTLAKGVFGAAVVGACEDMSTAMSVMTMAAATLVHHTARNAGISRGGLLDSFYDGLVTCMNNIDAKEASSES